MSFIRKKKVKGHEYAMEVENYRVDGKVRQRILRYMGRADADNPVSSVPSLKTASLVVHKTGKVSISISRKLKGKRVFVEFRYRVLPD